MRKYLLVSVAWSFLANWGAANTARLYEEMTIAKISNAIKELDRVKSKLRQDVYNEAKENVAKKSLKNIDPAISKAKELSRALYRLKDAERNYGDSNPSRIKQEHDYVARVKKEFLEKLKYFFDSSEKRSKEFLDSL